METLLSLLGFLWKFALRIFWGPGGQLDNSKALRATSPWTEIFSDLRGGDCSDPCFIVIILRDLLPVSWGRFSPCSHAFSVLGILRLWRPHLIGGEQNMHAVVAMEFLSVPAALKQEKTPIWCGSISRPVQEIDSMYGKGGMSRSIMRCKGRAGVRTFN